MGRALQGFWGPEAAAVHCLQPRGRAMLSSVQVTQLCLPGDDARARAVKEDVISSWALSSISVGVSLTLSEGSR